MADTVRISQTQLQAQSQIPSLASGVRAPAAAGSAATLGGYGRQGQAASTPTQPMAGDEFQRAVSKLNRTLESGAELRTNVPRGFYLNIRV